MGFIAVQYIFDSFSEFFYVFCVFRFFLYNFAQENS